MKKYAVYTRILTVTENGEETREIMVMNVESTSCGGAEHKVLGIHESIDNALAFDIEDSGTLKMMTEYITRCKCFDLKDFETRYRKLVAYRQSIIDGLYDELDDLQEEIASKNSEIAELDSRIRALRREVDRLNGDITDAKCEIADYCKQTRMRNQRSDDSETVIGLA